MVVIGCYLAYQTNSITIAEVNDNSELAISLFLTVLCGAFVGIMHSVDVDFRYQYSIEAYITNFVIGVIMYMLFHTSLGAICRSQDSDEDIKQIMHRIQHAVDKHNSRSKLTGSIVSTDIHRDVTTRSASSMFGEGIELTSIVEPCGVDLAAVGGAFDDNAVELGDFETISNYAGGKRVSTARLEKGDRVVVHNMRKSTKYNGQCGRIMSVAADGRFLVNLDDGRKIKAKAQNLRRALRESMHSAAVPVSGLRKENGRQRNVPRAKTVPTRQQTPTMDNMYSRAVSVDAGTVRSIEDAFGADIPEEFGVEEASGDIPGMGWDGYGDLSSSHKASSVGTQLFGVGMENYASARSGATTGTQEFGGHGIPGFYNNILSLTGPEEDDGFHEIPGFYNSISTTASPPVLEERITLAVSSALKKLPPGSSREDLKRLSHAVLMNNQSKVDSLDAAMSADLPDFDIDDAMESAWRDSGQDIAATTEAAIEDSYEDETDSAGNAL